MGGSVSKKGSEADRIGQTLVAPGSARGGGGVGGGGMHGTPGHAGGGGQQASSASPPMYVRSGGHRQAAGLTGIRDSDIAPRR
jgi:hypothetical protein